MPATVVEMPCPGGWSIGPFKDSLGRMVPRTDCPACGATGIPDEEGVRAEHPAVEAEAAWTEEP